MPFQLPIQTWHTGEQKGKGWWGRGTWVEPGGARCCWGHNSPPAIFTNSSPVALYTCGDSGDSPWVSGLRELASALLCSTPSPKAHLNVADTHVVLVSLQR